jgi:phosphoribosylanthranilate isomerase
VFVEPSDQEIQSTLDHIHLDCLQLYADGNRCRTVKARFGLPVWRAVGVSRPAELPASDDGLDGWVLEPKPPPGSTRPGGNAATMDHALLHGWQGPSFWLLAGGLTAQNVAAVVAQIAPPGVDVSSGVEIAPGVKSPRLIAQFVAAARR